MNTTVIGIDPGSVSGAYAVLDEQGRIVDVDDLPVVDRQIDAAELSRIVLQYRPVAAEVEDVWAFPGQGIMSSFRFGVSVGIIRGVIAAHGVPIYRIAPSKWKKHFRLDGDAEKSRALAISYWPSCRKLSRKRDHGRAEALLLARYYRETRA